MLRRLFQLLLLAAVLAGGYLYWRHRGFAHAPADIDALGRRVQDARIAASVEAAFELHAELSRCDAHVASEEGVVTLRGAVPSQALRRRAAEIAAAAPGARQIVNHLRVSDAACAAPTSERSLGESLDDSAVALRVRAACALDNTLRGAAIEVSAHRRVVTLTGEVADAPQAERALRIARETDGVASVVDRLRTRRGTLPAVERVRQALAADAHLARYRLSVSERDGRITLTGQVSTGAERELAGLLAATTAAAPVENRVSVGR
jgi:hyperosmotically inducible protein